MNSVLVRRAVANVSILTLAAGSALAYAQAESAVLYGSARIGFNSQKVGSGNEALQVTDNASRFGVRGSERLWTGVDAVYSYEFGFAADALGTTTGFGVRHGAVGLRSATFGTFAIGALDSGNPTGSPLYSQVTSIVSFAPGDAGPTAIGTSMLNSRNRTPNSIGYMSPKFGGATLRARYYLRGTGADESQLRSFDAGLHYEQGPLYAGIAFAQDSRKGGLQDNEFDDKMHIGVRYNMGFVQPYAMYGVDNYKGTSKTRDDVKWWLVGARVPIGDHSIVGNYAVREVQANLIGERKRAQVAFIYKFSRRTELSAYVDRDGIDSSRTGVAIRTLGTAIRHDF
jgi:predicted porin